MNLLKIKTPTVSGISAAMAIHDEFIYFIEIDEENKPQRKITVPLSEGCIVNGQIKNFTALEAAFSEIRKSIGKIHTPVSIGLPEGETIIRFPAFPDMSIEDIRGSLDLNFSEYFPFPRNEAVFDTIKIKTPDEARKTNNNITILAAAAKSQTVEHVLNAAHNAGIPAGPVEPLNFAMIRAIPDAYQGLCVMADHHNIVAVWNGDGIYFRIGDTQQNAQDIQNTIRYIEAQYRKGVEKIILLGSDFDIASSSGDEGGLRVIAERDEYYAARGLAMRETSGFPALDLRPQEFIDIERRRYTFNFNRLIIWGLIIAFFMVSLGTISYTFFCIQDINDKMVLIRSSVADLTPQRIALTKQNQELEQQNTTTEKVLKFLQEDIPVLEILNVLENSAGTEFGVKFDNADFSRNNEGVFVITLNGKAKDEKSLLTTIQKLNDSQKFSDINRPVSQQEQSGQVTFTLILEMGGDKNEG